MDNDHDDDGSDSDRLFAALFDNTNTKNHRMPQTPSTSRSIQPLVNMNMVTGTHWHSQPQLANFKTAATDWHWWTNRDVWFHRCTFHSLCQTFWTSQTFGRSGGRSSRTSSTSTRHFQVKSIGLDAYFTVKLHTTIPFLVYPPLDTLAGRFKIKVAFAWGLTVLGADVCGVLRFTGVKLCHCTDYIPNAVVELLPHRHCVGTNLTAP